MTSPNTLSKMIAEERKRRQQLIALAVEKSRHVQTPPTTTRATGRSPLTILPEMQGNDPDTGEKYFMLDYSALDGPDILR